MERLFGKDGGVEAMTESCIGSFFLDSGAHSLYTKRVIQVNGGRRGRGDYSFYETDEFWSYVDSYSEFVQKNREIIDLFVNVDVIFNPELTWKAQKYLEKKCGMVPVPVVHYGTSLRWLKRYLKEGHTLIGLGGLGQEVSSRSYYAWADRVFSYLCPPPQRLPVVRLHGFAMTAFPLMMRYPWWSVDSATWVKTGGWGGIFVPKRRKGKWDFSIPSYKVTVSEKNPSKKERGQHFFSFSSVEKRMVLDWLEYIGIECRNEEDVRGVFNHHTARKAANLHYFQLFCDSLPEWPWPFRLGFSTKGLLL